jgi:ribonuclease HI
MPDVTIYCDGSADKEGCAGWSAVLVGRRRTREVWEWDSKQDFTSQQAEILAVIKGFQTINRFGVSVRVVTDSNYIVRCFHELWLPKWRAKGWRVKGGGERPNRAYWETLEGYVALHDVDFIHIHGHNAGRRAGRDAVEVDGNAQAHMLANYARQKCIRERLAVVTPEDRERAREDSMAEYASKENGRRAKRRAQRRKGGGRSRRDR